MRCVQEFQQLRSEIIDAISNDIAELTEKIKTVANNPVVWKMLHDARNARRIDLYKVMGDGEAVVAVKRKMEKNAIPQ